MKMIPDFLFPHRCPVCHGIPPGGRRICPECEARLPLISGKRCRLCGKEIKEGMDFCSDCRETRRSFDEAASVFRYDEVLAETLACLKFKGIREYGEILGILAARYARPFLDRWKPEALAPVPVHKSKRKTRGYNQAEVICREFEKAYGIPMIPELLIRTRKTKALKNLSREERRLEVGASFEVNPKAEVPSRVLVVDDIFTTGATADACAAALKRKGAKTVFFLAAASGGGLQ